MLPRRLEPEVMDSPEEAQDYDAMDHTTVNRAFVADFLAVWDGQSPILDVGTGTAQIPIELCRRAATARVVAIDLAEHMLRLARQNAVNAELADRIQLQRQDAKHLPYPTGTFAALISNSIVHHIPQPGPVLWEMVRVVRPQGWIFVRDLMRPEDAALLQHLVATYAADATPHQRQMFSDSLRAALNLTEMRALVAELGFEPETVRQTSDRHWTWAARKP